MPRTSVSSSNLASVGYDGIARILEIQFRNGRIYQYFDVPESIYTDLLVAPSKGTYFHFNIKRAGFTFARII
jgi:hypothetical protein